MYISTTTASKILFYSSEWENLSSNEQTENLSKASIRIERLTFKSDGPDRVCPRYDAANARPTKDARLVIATANLALAYALGKVRNEGPQVSDLPVFEQSQSIGPIETKSKKKYVSVILDGPDLPVHVQFLLAPLCEYVNPDFRKTYARSINYED